MTYEQETWRCGICGDTFSDQIPANTDNPIQAPPEKKQGCFKGLVHIREEHRDRMLEAVKKLEKVVNDE